MIKEAESQYPAKCLCHVAVGLGQDYSVGAGSWVP